MNEVYVIGNVTMDPEITFTKTGMAKARFSVASNNSFLGKDGSDKESTDFINVVAWGKLAESIGDHVFKGTPVILRGRYTTRSYEDNGGGKSYYTCVTASYVGVSVYHLGGEKDAAGKGDSAGYDTMGKEVDEPIPF